MDSQFHSSSGSSSTPSAQHSKAFVASSTASVTDSSTAPVPWYLDSAATDHITNDMSNLSCYQPYQGSDQITIGNGNSIPIHHTGQAFEESASQRN
ncbi:unnamed protein product [Camellia sinensis]